MSTSTGSRWITFLLLGLVAVMAIEIGFLIYENRKLRAQLEAATLQFEPLAIGDRAPALSGQDIAGNLVAVKYGEGEPSTLFFCFSPSCDACSGNVEFWNTIFTSADPAALRCVGLCAGIVEEARQYVQEHGITYPVLSITDERLWAALHGQALPQTILIGSDGSVEGLWMGTLEPSQQEEISHKVEPGGRKRIPGGAIDNATTDSGMSQPH